MRLLSTHQCGTIIWLLGQSHPSHSLSTQYHANSSPEWLHPIQNLPWESPKPVTPSHLWLPVHYHNLDPNQKKLDKQSTLGIFIRFFDDSKACHIYDTTKKKIIKSHNVTFYESASKTVGDLHTKVLTKLKAAEDNWTPIDAEDKLGTLDSENETLVIIHRSPDSMEVAKLKNMRSQTRKRREPGATPTHSSAWLQAWMENTMEGNGGAAQAGGDAPVALAAMVESGSYREVMNRLEAEEWMMAME
ncbi:hypothetical protein FRB95_012573 [Tulasnella sp. JGI-2019a]|nr:hypothetical protein FRB95_012573 [Tulasnella sp. JGI-2019a]